MRRRERRAVGSFILKGLDPVVGEKGTLLGYGDLKF